MTPLPLFPPAPELRLCPAHQPEPAWLPVEEFGISRARPDGLNRYCRPCAHRKVSEHRQMAKIFPTRKPNAFARKPVLVQPERSVINLSDMASYVMRALSAGPKTQLQIESAIKSLYRLPREHEAWADAVADGIAELRFDFGVIDFDKHASPDARVYSLRRQALAHNNERKRA